MVKETSDDDDFILIRYDFRRGVDEQQDFFANLTRLVLETYDLNNQTKVVLVTHSMGGERFSIIDGKHFSCDFS